MTKLLQLNGIDTMVADDDPRLPATSASSAPAVPPSVTRRQGRLALLGAGLLDKVEAAVAASDRATQIWYADAEVWDRDDPHVLALAAALGLTPDQVDALFVGAAAQ